MHVANGRRSKLGDKGLDVLINNAGVCQYAPDGVKSDVRAGCKISNALTVQYALGYEKEGFTFMALSPGYWLKTDLGGGDMADLSAEDGTAASLDIILGPARGLNGKFPRIPVKGYENSRHQNDGSNAPW
ncbi:hypothetical protein BJX76DRAFT_361923 [Aspergillus varians]